MESWNRKVFQHAGINIDFIQDNHAYSKGVGVLRGLHFQAPPTAQNKLVWVTRGAVLDIIVDIRKGSPSYGQWGQFRLSAHNKLRLLVPVGFAHSYITLSEETEFLYKVDALYSPQDEGGIRWDDPELGITWPVAAPILSTKDTALPLWAEFDSPFAY